MSAVEALRAEGQSIWLDYIRRSLLESGGLADLIAHGGVTGVTSNPTIFEKAIDGSGDYDAAIRDALAREPGRPIARLFEELAVADIRRAADLLAPVFAATHGADGFVSLEVAPSLADDTDGTVAEARRLWAAVDRPNLLVKVPATDAGIPAIERLIAEGINVNVTLLFDPARYEAVAEAYLRGLGRAPHPERVASVASFFVSRIDTAVDRLLDADGGPAARALRGRAATALARSVYRRYRARFEGPAFAPWAARGARPQRLLWASTSVKDPAFRDTRYVEELIGPATVTTLPPATLHAFAEHGTVRGATLRDDGASDRTLADLARAGVDLAAVTARLLEEGVAAFAGSYATLLAALDQKRGRLGAPAAAAPWALGAAASAVAARLATWQAVDAAARFGRKDPTFWPDAPAEEVRDRMGWVHLPSTMLERVDELDALAAEARAAGYTTAVVLGMGGSSLAPDVFAHVFPPPAGALRLRVLDSTHPDAVRALAAELDLARTLFLVSSKSGTTAEPLAFFHYFWAALAARGEAPAPHFVAITDPGTPLAALGRERGFRRVVAAPPDVGGRYSALTVFGLVPAALAGVDLRRLLGAGHRMEEAGAFCVPVAESPAFRLGAALGELARAGRDKVTFLADPALAAFPSWVEQLIAESTGKRGRGIVPVVDEPALAGAPYGDDRLFVAIEGPPGEAGDAAARADRLAAAGHPVLRFALPDREALGGEFLRWETAVALAGPILGIDPYDQPDVELAKRLAREAMAAGGAAAEPPEALPVDAVDDAAIVAALDAWAADAGPSDYLGIQAYLAPTDATSSALARVRAALLARYRRATTLGYGPRFLHSTGQLHKGGPPTGRFLQLTDAPASDAPIPEEDLTFGRLIRAQALGDLRALLQRGRSVRRLELGAAPVAALERIARCLHG